MTIIESPCFRLSRRATAAISVRVRPGVSSMYSGAELISEDFCTRRRLSSCEMVPLRSRWPFTAERLSRANDLPVRDLPSQDSRIKPAGGY